MSAEIKKVFALSFNLKFTSELFTCVRDKALVQYKDKGLLLIGLQEVPKSVWDNSCDFYEEFCRSRRDQSGGDQNDQNLIYFQIEDSSSIFPGTHQGQQTSVFQTGHRMISAIRHPVGIGFINTHRKPEMDVHKRKVYWTTLRCTISRLMHGGTDYHGVNLNPRARALIVVGDFNADIDRDATDDDKLLISLMEEFGLNVVSTENTYFCDHSNTVARYDYILHTENLTFSKKLEDLETIQSDHKAIFAEFQITSNPLKTIPHGKYAKDNWDRFRQILGSSDLRF